MIRVRLSDVPAEVAAHYDDLETFYREVWGEHIHHGLWLTGNESPSEAVRCLIDRVTQLAGVRRGQRVCDVGCGFGATARILAKEYGVVVEAYTLSRAQHAYAQARLQEEAHGRVRCHHRDWLHNELAAASCDAVLAIECVSHMENKAAFFQEIRRVLKPEGRAVMCAWLCSDAASAFARRHLLEPICKQGCLPGLGSARDYRNLIAASDLEWRAFYDASRQVRRTWAIILRRLAGRIGTDARYRRYLLRGAQRGFAWTLPRILLGYYTGSVRYGIFVFSKPA